MAPPSKKPKPSKAPKDPLRVLPSGGYPLFQNVFEGGLGAVWDELAFWNFSKEREPSGGLLAYGKLWRKVLECQEFARHPRVGTAIEDFWLERFLDDPNPFHRKAELAPFSQISTTLVREYENELKGFLNHVVRVDWEEEIAPLYAKFGLPIPSLKDIRGLEAPDPLPPHLEARQKVKERILAADSPEIVKEIAGFFYRNGLGLFGRYRAFRWQERGQGGGKLTGVEAVDLIRLENLIGYDEQRRPLIENIEAFVAGKGANNALLYGERGTGKSSTVKALFNAYQDKGLRLVEVHPSQLDHYQEILFHLRGRREKFILFVDDLSFEENETSYKGLKALLEGTVEATPDNVILIATSNRRHLVREFFGDRAEGEQKDGEIHGADTVEEKLSLSDRFGLVISFYSPDQDTYFKMVDNWARVEGIRMAPAELHAKAALWERTNNLRSGRTARQFINDLKGKV